MLGVWAVFAARACSTAVISLRGFHDETLALLRYAQKTAIGSGARCV